MSPEKADYFVCKGTVTFVRKTERMIYKACPSEQCNKRVMEVCESRCGAACHSSVVDVCGCVSLMCVGSRCNDACSFPVGDV